MNAQKKSEAPRVEPQSVTPEPLPSQPSIVQPPEAGHVREEKAQQERGKQGADPAHRFHKTGKPNDDRRTVAAGEALQRVRGRHFDSSLRPAKKAPASD